MDIFTGSPTLGDEDGEPIALESTSVHYSVKAVRNSLTYRDIGLAFSSVELEDHWLVNFVPSMIVTKNFLKFKNILGDFYKPFGSDATNI